MELKIQVIFTFFNWQAFTITQPEHIVQWQTFKRNKYYNFTSTSGKISYLDFNANQEGYCPGVHSNARNISVNYRDAPASAVTASALPELCQPGRPGPGGSNGNIQQIAGLK